MAKYISKLINGEELYYLKDSEARANLIDKSEKGAVSGVATLDENGKVPSSQLPASHSGVSKITVGETEYDPIDGNVTIPAYPTELPASDVSEWAKASTKPSYTKSEVGLGNVTNDAQVKRTEMGAASGVATLDSAGKIPSSQLPSYVDDVLEYDTKSDFPATGEAGKIYVDKSTNTTWRWSGSTYTQIKGDLVIGTTTGTAADGGVANTHYNNTSNPHNVTKAQVGLGSVVNTGDSATPVSGGTTKFTTGGAYTELAKKVDKVDGKGLSTNDYTTNEKNKLSGIESGAQVHKAPTAAEVKSALGTGSGTSKYLREDGSWQTPPDTNTWPSKTSQLTNDSGYITRITKAMVTNALGYTPPTSDTNTWRGLQNNLTSTSTSDSLSAYQGYLLAHGSARDDTKVPIIDAVATLTNAQLARYFAKATTISAEAQFAAITANAEEMQFGRSQGRGYIWGTTNGAYLSFVGGNVGVQTSATISYKLHVNGSVGATGYNNTSDIRKKNIIENLNLDINDIANAPIFKFTWLDPEIDNGVNIGTSAQYWRNIVPEIVSEANDDEKTLSMQYGVAGLASSVALAKKVVEQENTIKA